MHGQQNIKIRQNGGRARFVLPVVYLATLSVFYRIYYIEW